MCSSGKTENWWEHVEKDETQGVKTEVNDKDLESGVVGRTRSGLVMGEW